MDRGVNTLGICEFMREASPQSREGGPLRKRLSIKLRWYWACHIHIQWDHGQPVCLARGRYRRCGWHCSGGLQGWARSGPHDERFSTIFERPEEMTRKDTALAVSSPRLRFQPHGSNEREETAASAIAPPARDERTYLQWYFGPCHSRGPIGARSQPVGRLFS